MAASHPPGLHSMKADPCPSSREFWVPQWTSVRKLKEGPVTADLYGFLTTDPNKEVGALHPKAMPVILTTVEEIDPLDDRAGRRGAQAATAVAGWQPANCGARRQNGRRPRRVTLLQPGYHDVQDRCTSSPSVVLRINESRGSEP